MIIKDITSKLEEWAPLAYQEGYDNCGLLVGDYNQTLTNVLITLDVTEVVVDEAIQKGCNLIVAHHPLIFGGVDQITTRHWVGRCLQKAIKNDVSIYALHTNLDNVISGVNAKIAEKLELQDLEILSPKSTTLLKLVTFVPVENSAEIMEALFEAGAGQIGQYDECSFQVEGIGSFRPNKNTNPLVGVPDKLELVIEKRLEVVIPSHLQSTIISILKLIHPYEEAAYFIVPINNDNSEIGSGIIGHLATETSPSIFLENLKKQMNLSVIRHTQPVREKIARIAICGGSGSFLLNKAIARNADVLVTADFKYHEFFEANNEIMIADIGHYESEVHTKELIYDYLSQKFANIAFHLSEVVTNPIIYT